MVHRPEGEVANRMRGAPAAGFGAWPLVCKQPGAKGTAAAGAAVAAYLIGCWRLVDTLRVEDGEQAMTIRLTCMETGRSTERNWADGQAVGQVECDALRSELGGEPTGDVVLVEMTREGSESTRPRQWRVHVG